MQNLQKAGTVENLGIIPVSTKIKKRMSLLEIDDNAQNLVNNKVENIPSNIGKSIFTRTEANSKEKKKEINKEVKGKRE